MTDPFDTTPHSPVKIIADATVRHEDQRLAGIGYLLLNHNERVVDRGTRTLGTGYTTTQAELYAIREAIEQVSSYEQTQHVIVHSDSKNALSLARQTIAHDVEEVFESIRFEYRNRNQTKGADIMADRALCPVASDYRTPTYGMTD